MTYPAVRLERTLPADPLRVYRAWLEEDMLIRWAAPGDFTVRKVEVDERVGGHYRIWQVDTTGTDVGGFEAQIEELSPAERLVFRWAFVGPDREALGGSSRLTITLRPAGGSGTALTLLHERLDDLAAALPDVAGNVEAGWASALTHLTTALEG